ncbi:hypothetical protein pb186bvf_019911 [Paramecium bursaria]
MYIKQFFNQSLKYYFCSESTPVQLQLQKRTTKKSSLETRLQNLDQVPLEYDQLMEYYQNMLKKLKVNQQEVKSHTDFYVQERNDLAPLLYLSRQSFIKQRGNQQNFAFFQCPNQTMSYLKALLNKKVLPKRDLSEFDDDEYFDFLRLKYAYFLKNYIEPKDLKLPNTDQPFELFMAYKNQGYNSAIGILFSTDSVMQRSKNLRVGFYIDEITFKQLRYYNILYGQLLCVRLKLKNIQGHISDKEILDRILGNQQVIQTNDKLLIQAIQEYNQRLNIQFKYSFSQRFTYARQTALKILNDKKCK